MGGGNALREDILRENGDLGRRICSLARVAMWGERFGKDLSTGEVGLCT